VVVGDIRPRSLFGAELVRATAVAKAYTQTLCRGFRFALAAAATTRVRPSLCEAILGRSLPIPTSAARPVVDGVPAPPPQIVRMTPSRDPSRTL